MGKKRGRRAAGECSALIRRGGEESRGEASAHPLPICCLAELTPVENVRCKGTTPPLSQTRARTLSSAFINLLRRLYVRSGSSSS